MLDGLDAIVGDEAHIRSRKPTGPRHDPAYPQSRVDTYANLILLCKAHHKLVDDNWEVFGVEQLEKIKREHERRVQRSLATSDVGWIEEPELVAVVTGTELAGIVMGAFGYFLSNDHPRDDVEALLISGFLQEVQDWGDIAGDVGARGRVEAAMSLHGRLEELGASGFVVVGGLGLYRIQPDFPVSAAVVRVSRVVDNAG